MQSAGSAGAETKPVAAITTPGQEKLRDWINSQFDTLSKGREAEEREWFESALFYQMRQWLEEDPTNRRLRPKQKDKDNPKPMPVSNYYTLTIDINANALGAAIPVMAALSNNYDSKNRSAADAAERAIEEANREAKFEYVNPILALHAKIFGTGVTKDWIEVTDGAETVPTLTAQEVPSGVECPVCGYTEPATPSGAGVGPAPDPSQLGQDNSQQPRAQQPAQQSNSGVAGASGSVQSATLNPTSGSPAVQGTGSAPQQYPGGAGGPAPGGIPGQQLCPRCHQGVLEPATSIQDVPGEGIQSPTSKLACSLPMIFQVYIPRDCTDANISPLVIEWYKKPVSEWKAKYPDLEIQEDNKNDAAPSSWYVQSLRRLNSGTSTMDEAPGQATGIECWVDWNRLEDATQKTLTADWQGQPCDAYPQMDMLQAAMAYGLFQVQVGDQVVETKPNPFKGYKPYTFFHHKKDPASVYPPGLSVSLKPLQKQVNRLDSLMERALMANSAGKWLIPISQDSRFKPSGDPVDQLRWDAEDGKAKPEYVQPTPYHAAAMQRRQMLVQEFQTLGYSSSVDQGGGSAGAPFRSLAYMGAKAEESRKTQRFLWEQGHELRAKKQLEMARVSWNEPRKVKVSGFNNQFGEQELESADLAGEYAIQVVQDSSRPKNLDEKVAALQTMFGAGLIDPKDPTVKAFIVEAFGMQDLNLMDDLQEDKATRDLEALKQGIQPMENPFIKWDIPLDTFSKYIQTEEYEQLPQNIRGGILMYTQWCSDQLTAATQGPQALAPPNAQQRAVQAAHGMQPSTPGHTLHGVPGASTSTGATQNAALKQGDTFADSLPDTQATSPG